MQSRACTKIQKGPRLCVMLSRRNTTRWICRQSVICQCRTDGISKLSGDMPAILPNIIMSLTWHWSHSVTLV